MRKIRELTELDGRVYIYIGSGTARAKFYLAAEEEGIVYRANLKN